MWFNVSKNVVYGKGVDVRLTLFESVLEGFRYKIGDEEVRI